MDAIFTRFSSRVDSSVGFSGCSPELTSSEKCALFDLQGKNVRLLVQPIDTPPEELVTVRADLQQKTPSQRLRAVIFISWKQQQQEKSFDKYYADKMNAIIDQIKATLEPNI